MGKSWRYAVSMVFLGLVGCGPSEGDRFDVPHTTELYYNKADAESGKPKDAWFSLMTTGKMAMIDNTEVKILESGKPWIKVEVMAGRDYGSTGWIEARKLGDKR